MPHDSTAARRLFIAVDPPDDVKRRLVRLVRVPPEGVRAVMAGQMHLTLHFLGDVADETAGQLGTALRTVHSDAFTIDLCGVGCFPSPRRARVLWAGVQPSQPLALLHRSVGDVIKACGISVDDRPFAPHVTLARLTPRMPQRWLADVLAATADFVVAAIPVTAFILFHSRRTDDGHEHVRVESYPLGA